MNCKTCKEPINQKRAELGYNVCVKCSNVEAYGCVDVVYHKTGNTIQIMPKDQADKINKLAERSGFGTLRSLRSGKSNKEKRKIETGCSLSYVGSKANYEKIGERCMLWVELKEWDKIEETLEKARQNLDISNIQYQKLKRIMSQFIPKIQNKVISKKEEVSEEINHVFRNWKNSKVYR